MEDLVGREARPILVQTLHGRIKGLLHINSRLRTLDHLNLNKKFLTIEAPEIALPGWSFEAGNLSINTDQILFVMELKDTLPTSDQRVEASHFTRTAIRVRLDDYDLQGFIHVRGVGDPVARLSQNKQPFIALTSVSVVGPESDFATSFLALNPLHILATQEILQAGLSRDDERAATGAEAC
jgi:hypothetical protein